MSPERVEMKFNKLIKENIEERSSEEIKEQLIRAKQLLRAATLFADQCGDSMVFYDGTECDRDCFIEDVRVLFSNDAEEEFLP